MEATPTPMISYFSGFKQNMVPLFQRRYTWADREWRTLWEDVAGFYGHESADLKSTHFMGAVVTMPARSVPVGVSKFLVIDGQQRLTTVAILLCAIRDELDAAEQVLKARIQRHYLTNEGFDGSDFFKLLPTQGDRPAYSPLIQNSKASLPDSRFKQCYDFFRRRLKDHDDDGNLFDVRHFLEIVETRLMVVMIDLSDNDDPYLIFESLNFKGSPLEQSDLVRNYFLMRFPVTEQQQVYDDLWLPMQTRLGPSLTEFMRHFLGAEGEEIRKGDVYAAIKRLVADSATASVRLLMSRMENLSVLYSRIATLADDESNQQLARFFARFRRLDFGTAYPLLLSLYEDHADGQFDAEEFIECLRILDSYIVRRMVAGVPSNSLSGTFISLCKSKPVTNEPAAWLSGVLAREGRNRRWLTDAEFHDSWLKRPIYPGRVCPVILECIEEHFGHHESVEFANATIEHIMPQTLSPAWVQDLGDNASDIHSEWVNTIGNLTLTGYNPELGNMGYSDKRSIYAMSHFELNRYFAAYETWSGSEIQRRAKTLFQKALELWPRPAIMPDQQGPAQQSGPANFHAHCIRLAEKRLHVVLSKLSQTRYETGDHETRLVCAVSTEHNEGGGIPYFWFAFHRKQLEFLEAVSSGWLCLGCGSAAATLVVAISIVRPLLDQMSMSGREDDPYWHVVVQKKGAKLAFRLLGGMDSLDLTNFLVSA